MRQRWAIMELGLMLLAGCSTSAMADGMVFGPAYFPKVEIPNQQALIYFADGREHLVIETAFLGQGTNFAWVVPLPAVADIQPVSPELFDRLREAFQPQLIHPVTRYYLGLLFVCGWAFLGWRSFKDEVAWMNDLPVCLLLAAGAWYGTGSLVLGGIALAVVVYVRLFTGSTTNYSLGLLVCLACVVLTGVLRGAHKSGLMQTLGDSDRSVATIPQVTILARQRAGIFETTTIKGENAKAVLDWLEQNEFVAPVAATDVIRQYVERGWVFVAAKARREHAGNLVSTLHPLSFTFPTTVPVYPLQLTGVNPSKCLIDLYVFGNRRAKARGFSVVRCDRVAPPQPGVTRESWRHVGFPELAEYVGAATVGTKLSGNLAPSQMKADAEITWSRFSRSGGTVYSRSSASTVALNVTISLGMVAWLATGACRGGWKVEEWSIRRWRWGLTAAALVVGVLVFATLPKSDIITRNDSKSTGSGDE